MMARSQTNKRGSQIVEASLILVPTLALSFLLFDMSFAFFQKTTLQSAVREGVRFAVTGQTLGTMGQDDSIKSVVRQFAVGLLSGSNRDKVFVRYYTPDTFTLTNSNASGNIVEVSVEGFQYTPMAKIMHSGDSVALTVRSSDRVEPRSSPPAR